MKKKFDIAVIGGGPGGYPAAIKAAQQGAQVALIEAKKLGGTCLNRGCIPSKSLISSAQTYKKILEAEKFGIKVSDVSFDYSQMVNHKDKTVENVLKGLDQLIQSNGITLIRGFGKFVSPKEIKIMNEENFIIHAEKTIVATGSEPKNMRAFPFDHERIHDSTSILEMKKLPKSLVIVGGGIIGCEFASLFINFDVDVTVLEMMPNLLPTECSSMSSGLEKAYKRKGIKVQVNALVEGIDHTDKGVKVRLAGGKSIDAEMALVAVGRELNVEGIGLDKAGVALTPDGFVKVDEHMETTTPGIYAIGDIASKWWLAHVATHQGLVAASHAMGQDAAMYYNAVPSVIFTDPEIATVGLTLDQAVSEGYNATLGAFPFQALGKSQADLQTDGFGQIVIDRDSRQVLGAQVLGYGASSLIAEMALAIANELTVECITETIHAHPTIAEVWMEAAFIAGEKPLHLPPKKKRDFANVSG